MRRANIAVLLVLVLALLCACVQQPPYRDGVYRAEADKFANGWKETVEITIAGGRIDKINWDAVSEDPSIPTGKKQYSKSGLYGMLAGAAKNEWCDQAKAAEDYVMKYGLDKVPLTEDGHTDAISGCTVHVNQFVGLAQKCLAQAVK